MTALQSNQQIVYDTARACGLPDIQSKIIVGQATLESGNFTSPTFKDDNNPWGMHYPSVRPKFYIAGKSTKHSNPASEGTPTPYAHYDSLQQSVKDMVLGWHVYNKTDWSKLTTPTAYANYLKQKNYYQGALQSYIDNIAAAIRKMTWLKPTAIGGGIILLLVVGFYFFTLKN